MRSGNKYLAMMRDRAKLFREEAARAVGCKAFWEVYSDEAAEWAAMAEACEAMAERLRESTQLLRQHCEILRVYRDGPGRDQHEQYVKQIAANEAALKKVEGRSDASQTTATCRA